MLSSDTSVMKREIEKWEGEEGFERYLQWLGEAHRHYEIIVLEVLHKSFTSIFNLLLRLGFLSNVFKLHLFESVYSRAARYFWTERLRRVFTFGSMYMGMSPFDAPGTYSLLQYAELAEGIWYPAGGFHAVIAALVRVCERLGVRIRLNSPVSSILTTHNGQIATGVELSNGEQLMADLVVINADLVYAYHNLFPTTPSPYASSLKNRSGSCSSISFYWALSQTIPELQTHNVFLADEYRESFDSRIDPRRIPENSSYYVNVPSRIDPTAAPEGCDSLVVFIPIGHLRHSSIAKQPQGDPSAMSSPGLEKAPEQDWPSIIASARETAISTIESRTGCAKLGPLIMHEELNTPLTWESRFNLDRGSIMGSSHPFFDILAFHRRTKHPQIKNVFFVGASTHLGAGVPMVLAGAKLASEQILREMGVGIPLVGKGVVVDEQSARRGEGTSELDRIRREGAILSNFGIWMLAVFVLSGFLVYMKSGLVVKWDAEEKRGWGMETVVSSPFRKYF